MFLENLLAQLRRLNRSSLLELLDSFQKWLTSEFNWEDVLKNCNGKRPCLFLGYFGVPCRKTGLYWAKFLLFLNKREDFTTVFMASPVVFRNTLERLSIAMS